MLLSSATAHRGGAAPPRRKGRQRMVLALADGFWPGLVGLAWGFAGALLAVPGRGPPAPSHLTSEDCCRPCSCDKELKDLLASQAATWWWRCAAVCFLVLGLATGLGAGLFLGAVARSGCRLLRGGAATSEAVPARPATARSLEDTAPTVEVSRAGPLRPSDRRHGSR